MLLLSTFIVVAGTALLLRRPGTQKFYQQEIAAQRAEEREKKIDAVCAALALIAAAILLGLMTNWNVHTLSGMEAQKMITAHKDARFEVFQYNNGSKELWINSAKESPSSRIRGAGG